jgi:hypothetical protein
MTVLALRKDLSKSRNDPFADAVQNHNICIFYIHTF